MIVISPLPELPVLEEHWRHLAAKSPHSFFLSWTWISTWLHCIPRRLAPKLLEVSADGTLIAAGIIVKRTIWRHKLIPVKTWILNATGDRLYDRICTEHNGLLAAAHHARGAWDEVLEHFATREKNWDEFQLDGVPPWLADAWAKRGMTLRHTRLDVGRLLDLERVRATPSCSCVGILAPRVRTRVRHTLAAVERRLGPVIVAEPATLLEARNFFAEMKELHIRRWRNQPHGDAFDTPFFERFHHELIARSFPERCVQLARVSAGPKTLGLLYNFVYQGRVSFYQSGINYAVAERGDSLGLLVHALVIGHNARRGQAIYDMLAGDAQYKRALAGITTPLWWGELQAERHRLRAAGLLTNCVQTLRTAARQLRG
jgi:hypothetical protein